MSIECASKVPREVLLPCCQVCGHIGKLPGQRRMRSTCTGPPGEIHKQTKMTPVLFREVPDEA